jgi:hypothetical protein
LKRAVAQAATPGWFKDERAEALVAAKGKRLVAQLGALPRPPSRGEGGPRRATGLRMSLPILSAPKTGGP